MKNKNGQRDGSLADGHALMSFVRANRCRLIATAIMMVAAVLLYFLAPTPATMTIEETPGTTITSTSDRITKLCDWIALFLVIACFWVWRRDFGITGFGPLSWPGMDQQSPSERQAAAEDAAPRDEEASSVVARMEQADVAARKERILQMVRERHAVNAAVVARDLRVSTTHAKTLLFTLVEEGAMRCDGFPRASLYTLTSSPENLAIDFMRDRLQKKHPQILERRFVRVGRRYEIDAVIKAEGLIFLIEVKYVRRGLSEADLGRWMERLCATAEHFPSEHTRCYLVLVVFDVSRLGEIEARVARFTFESGAVPTEIVVVSTDQLGIEDTEQGNQADGQ